MQHLGKDVPATTNTRNNIRIVGRVYLGLCIPLLLLGRCGPCRIKGIFFVIFPPKESVALICSRLVRDSVFKTFVEVHEPQADNEWREVNCLNAAEINLKLKGHCSPLLGSQTGSRRGRVFPSCRAGKFPQGWNSWKQPRFLGVVVNEGMSRRRNGPYVGEGEGAPVG
jgi:hypothetical protein